MLRIAAVIGFALLAANPAWARGGGHSSHGSSARSSGGHYSSPGGNHSVRGHVTRKGTYVQPHRATNRDSTKRNNYSTRGNFNPYTGKPGTRNP